MLQTLLAYEGMVPFFEAVPAPPQGSDHTYYGTAAQDQLSIAQAEIDRHATSGDGLCVTCQVPGPCPRRETAVKIFSRYHRQTRRQPPAARTHRPGLRALRGRPFTPGPAAA